MATMAAPNPAGELYTPTQVDQYLRRINFPTEKCPKITPEAARTREGLVYLTQLQQHHLTSVPFENLSLHYSKFPGISLDKEDLFEKIVDRRRGGYCMEVNFLFATVLKTLGYEVAQIGARVFGPSGETGQWSHQINFVRLDAEIFVVEVGFGSTGSTKPLPLIDGAVSKWGATDAEMRLTYHQPRFDFLHGQWFYEHRPSPSVDWKRLYSFGMTEFLPRDFEVMSFATSTRKTSWFTKQVICMIMLFDEERGDIIGTTLLLDKNLKRSVRGESEILPECKTEADRIKALGDYFGVVLSDKEQAGIRGIITEIV